MSSRPASWTVIKILQWTSHFFQEKAVGEPWASAKVLLAHVLGLSRLDLYLRHEQPLTPEELARFRALVKRRAAGEPTAYLTGSKEFWSLDFKVTPAVLIPRPETEVLVEAVRRIRASTDRGTINLKGQVAMPYYVRSANVTPDEPRPGFYYVRTLEDGTEQIVGPFETKDRSPGR